MPKYIQFNEDIIEFPDDMPDAEIESILQKEYSRPRTFTEQAGEAFDASARGLARFAGQTMAGPGMLLGGVAGQLGAKDFADKMFRESDSWRKWGEQQAQQAAPTPQTMPGQVIENVMSLLPGAVGPTAPVVFPQTLSGMTGRLQEELNQRLPLDVAQTVGQQQVVANAALGPLRGIGPFTGAVINAAAGGAADVVSSQYLKQKGHEDVAEQFFNPLDPTARATEAILGGVVGWSGRRPKKAPETTTVVDQNAKLAEIDQAKKPTPEPEPPQPPPIHQLDLPLDIRQGIDTSGVRNPYDLSGRVSEYPTGKQLGIEGTGQGELFGKAGPIEMGYRAEETPSMITPSREMDAYAESVKGMGEVPVKLPEEPASPGSPTGLKDPFIVPKSQRGAISQDLLGIGKATDILQKAGKLALWRKFAGTFSEAKMFAAEHHALNPNSKETLVFMKPQDFLDLAYQRPKERLGEMAEEKRRSIRKGIQSEKGLNDIPYLFIAKRGDAASAAEVVGHEGRHRADVFIENGVDLMPVRIRDEEAILGRDLPYTHILSENGLKIHKFPERVVIPMGVPKSQRGGAKGSWNPFKVKEDAKKFVTDLTKQRKDMDGVKITDDINAKQSVFEKVGIKGLDLIDSTKPLTPELLDEFRSAPDVGPVKKIVPGAVFKDALNKNPVILWAHRNLDDGFKRGQHLIREWIRPVEELAYPVLRNKENLLRLHNIFMREMANKTRYSADELRSAGIPEKVINVYDNMRVMYDKVLEKMNQARAEKGLKPIKAEDAYLSARWEGPWKIAIYEKRKDGSRGKPVWQIAERSRGRAKQALKHLQDKNLLNDLIVDELRYAEGDSSGSPFKTAYYDLVDLLGKDDPRAQAIMEALKEEAAYTTTNIVGQEKHFKRKTGARGFAGDRPWMDPIKDARDMFVQQFQYAKNALVWAEYQNAMGQIRALMSDADWKQSHPNAAAFISYYTKAHAGLATTKDWSAIENGLAKTLGTDVKKLEATLGISKGGFYVHTLSWNLPFLVTQIVQPTFTIPKHAEFTQKGYSHNPAASFFEGNLYGVEAYKYARDMYSGNEAGAKKILESLPPVYRDALRYLEANRLIDINPTSDITDLYLPQGARTTIELASLPIVESEKIARATAFMSFVSHFDQSGKFSKDLEGQSQMFRLAEEATNFTMVDYRPQERAQLFNEMGLAGHALNTFTAFKINQLAQIASYYHKAKGGDPKPLLLMAAIMYGLGGATGMVGIEDADTLLELTKAAVKSFGGDIPRNIDEFSVKGFLLQTPEIVSIGPTSSLTGLNLYTRFNQSNIIPVDPLDPAGSFQSMFPFASAAYMAGTGLKDMIFNQDQSAKLAGGYKATPPGLRGLYEEFVPGMKIDNMAQSPSSPGSRGVYERSPAESKIRMTGFKSTQEALTRERDFQAQRNEKKASEKRSTIANRFRNNFALGKVDKVEEAINDYIEWGGNVDTLLSQSELEKRLVGGRTTELQRLAIAAKSGNYPQVQALIRRLQQ
jgi:hypothetical protein